MEESEAGRKEVEKKTLCVTFSFCQEGNYCISGLVGPELILLLDLPILNLRKT